MGVLLNGERLDLGGGIPHKSSLRGDPIESWKLIWVCLKMFCTPINPMALLIIIPFLNGYFIKKY